MKLSGRITYKTYINILVNTMRTMMKKSTDIKAIEMRIRRAIDKALRNVASMGIEDYNNEQFLRFTSTLFDFTEVKKEMDYLRGKSSVSGKINIKNFWKEVFFYAEHK